MSQSHESRPDRDASPAERRRFYRARERSRDPEGMAARRKQWDADYRARLRGQGYRPTGWGQQ